MGEHDQTVPHDADAHKFIDDDGRTLRLVRNISVEYVADARLAYVFRGEKLICETVYVQPGPYDATSFESLYSSVFANGHWNYVEPSFAPIVDDSWRVVGHLGWADGYDICVPYDTVRKGSNFWYILQKLRLDRARQQLLDEADRFDRMSPPFPVRPAHAPVPPGRFSTMWDDARRGPLKDKSIEETYKNNLDYFVRVGGKAVVGVGPSFDSDYASYLDLPPPGLPDEGVWGRPNKPFSSGYQFLVLVNPDGYLQGVLGVQKVPPKMYGERAISIALDVIDIALTVLLIVDIVTIPVVLFRAGVVVARAAAIRALELVIDREGKAALDLLLQRARKELVGAMTGPEQAEAKSAWEKLKQKFWDAGDVPPSKQFSEAQAKEWNRKIAERMRQLGIPKKNIGAGSKIIPPGAKTPKGKPYPVGDEIGKAFNPSGSTRGGRVRSSPVDEYGGTEGGISVHGNVFDRWEGFDLWNDPTTLVEDRIDATIAHEWSEFNGLSHWETVELAPQTALPIRPRARELLREMAKWGNSEKAFTEFTKAEWNAIKAAGKEAASFEEKKAAAAAAKAVK
jgi:hypothetical protein